MYHNSASIVFTPGPIFRFFAMQEWHVALVKVIFGRKELKSPTLWGIWNQENYLASQQDIWWRKIPSVWLWKLDCQWQNEKNIILEGIEMWKNTLEPAQTVTTDLHLKHKIIWDKVSSITPELWLYSGQNLSFITDLAIVIKTLLSNCLKVGFH